VVQNYKPKTLNALDAFTIHGDKFATARATHLLIGQLKDTGMGKWGVKDNAPEGWVPVAQHADEFRNLVGYTDPMGLPAAAEQRLFVPKFIDDALRPITDPDYMGRIPLFRAMRQTQAAQKAIQLGLSFFHATTEQYMSLANSGVKGYIQALRADRDSPEFQSAERDMIAHGGTTSIQGKTVEAYRSLQPGSVPSWGDIWRHAPVAREMDALANKITDFTFNNLQRRFKVTDYQLHLAGWMAKHPNATIPEIGATKASMAKEINAVYGGLNAENLGISRAVVETARGIMLAPDWTFSNVFNVQYALERGNTPAGKMARMFWMRQLVGGVALTQLTTLMFTRGAAPGLLHPHSVGGVARALTHVYMGKDKDGKEIWVNMYFKGSGGDGINYVSDTAQYGAVQGSARFMAGKAAGVPRAALQLISNRDFLGKKIVPDGMNPIASTLRAAYITGKTLAPVPFSVSNMWDMLAGPDADKYKPSEVAVTMLAGNAPRHVAPEGMHMTSSGLQKNNPERRARSMWDQMTTGKVDRPSTDEEIKQDLRDHKISGAEARRARGAAARAREDEGAGLHVAESSHAGKRQSRACEAQNHGCALPAAAVQNPGIGEGASGRPLIRIGLQSHPAAGPRFSGTLRLYPHLAPRAGRG
jgi:hypothetical protein